jgi:hypothetical protein
MTISLFHHARFEVSVADPQNLPQGGPEIAFAGRSNAGKSSAINALAGQTRLAYVSKTPGRTQLINVFRLKCGAALIDLPGYGFSVAPDAVRTRVAPADRAVSDAARGVDRARADHGCAATFYRSRSADDRMVPSRRQADSLSAEQGPTNCPARRKRRRWPPHVRSRVEHSRAFRLACSYSRA